MLLKELIENQSIQGAGENEQYFNTVVDTLRDELGIPENVELKIALKHNMPLDKGQKGLTIPNPNNPNQMFVFLNPNLVGAEVVSTIAHELVHVKQISDGRMNIQLKDGAYEVEWEGRPLKQVRYSRSHPWEVEAHTQERPLMQSIIKKLGNAST